MKKRPRVLNGLGDGHKMCCTFETGEVIDLKNVLEFLESSAKKYPQKIAIAGEESSLTYEELLALSRRIGAALCRRLEAAVEVKVCGEADNACGGAEDVDSLTGGGRSGRRAVAVLAGKTPEAVAAFMGVLYSGNFYVVLDVDIPAERAGVILDTLHPAAIVTDSAHEEKARELPNVDVILNIDEAAGEAEISGGDEDRLCQIRESMTDADPVYALFTSGSTGTPKGTVVTHANVIAYTEWFSKAFDIEGSTVFGSQTPFYFSMSVSDMYSTLRCGATLHIIPKAYFTFPVKLMEFLNEREVNTIYWVPSALGIVAGYDMFRYAQLPHMKKVLFAGEVMPTKWLNYWRRNLPDAVYANLFGPTETTDICTYYVVDREFRDDEPIPIGRACDNCDVFVVDGELYVRGAFVAKGYYGNPEKTREAFVQNPQNPDYPETVYRTGDLVRYNERGELVYVCRRDYQIKHMGYRIELGEVEAAAGAIEGLRSYACVYDEENDRLVFFYEGRRMDDSEIRGEFRKRVPKYMEPDRYVRLSVMPHNANGKIDRKKLMTIM